LIWVRRLFPLGNRGPSGEKGRVLPKKTNLGPKIMKDMGEKPIPSIVPPPSKKKKKNHF